MGKERGRLIPIQVTTIFYLDHCRWLFTVLPTGQRYVQIWLHVTITQRFYFIWSKFSLQHSTTLPGCLHGILIWPSLNHSTPPRSQFSLKIPESSQGPLVFISPSAFSALVQKFQGPLSNNYQLSSRIRSKSLLLN